VEALDLLVLGEANVDLIVRAEDPTPVYGQEKLVEDLILTVGGSASIFACQAARLGLRTALASIVGEDEFGDFMLRALAERGVGTHYIQRTTGLKTGATISLTTAQDRALLTHAGTIAALDSATIQPQWLRQAGHVHAASFFLQPQLAPGLPALLAEARRGGTTVSMDTGWDPANRWDSGLAGALAHVDVFMPNEGEALHISGRGSIEEALSELARRIPVVVIKLGAGGAVARRGPEVVRVASIPVQVVDTTGAGDSFGAGFVYGYRRGMSLAECLECGVICGALSTRAPGGTGSQATLDEVRAIWRL
jgi:sugar/nucleoside kinase (ribokinase family)